MQSCAEITGTSVKTVSRACKGEYAQAAGFYFRRLHPDVVVGTEDLDTLRLEEYDELCGEILQFPTGASLARPPSFPTGQLTVRRLAAGDCGHNLGNALFSSSVRTAFPLPCILSPAALGRLMALFLHVLFSGGVLNTPSDLKKS